MENGYGETLNLLVHPKLQVFVNNQTNWQKEKKNLRVKSYGKEVRQNYLDASGVSGCSAQSWVPPSGGRGVL